MAYPDDFDTSAFPAGKRIAVSRTAGIWIMVSMFLIVATCIALPWIQHSKKIDPFVIYIDGPHGKWELLGHQKIRQAVPYYVSLQRSLVGVFTEKWFSVSDNMDVNEKRWSQCNRETVCANRIENSLWNERNCDIYCLASNDMYANFESKVLPLYRTVASFGERWTINPSTITVTPNGSISNFGGSWIVHAQVRSSVIGEFNIVAYVNVEHDLEHFPQTVGYYISDFNAYREQ